MEYHLDDTRKIIVDFRHYFPGKDVLNFSEMGDRKILETILNSYYKMNLSPSNPKPEDIEKMDKVEVIDKKGMVILKDKRGLPELKELFVDILNKVTQNNSFTKTRTIYIEKDNESKPEKKDIKGNIHAFFNPEMFIKLRKHGRWILFSERKSTTTTCNIKFINGDNIVEVRGKGICNKGNILKDPLEIFKKIKNLEINLVKILESPSELLKNIKEIDGDILLSKTLKKDRNRHGPDSYNKKSGRFLSFFNATHTEECELKHNIPKEEYIFLLKKLVFCEFTESEDKTKRILRVFKDPNLPKKFVVDSITTLLRSKELDEKDYNLIYNEFKNVSGFKETFKNSKAIPDPQS